MIARHRRRWCGAQVQLSSLKRDNDMKRDFVNRSLRTVGQNPGHREKHRRQGCHCEKLQATKQSQYSGKDCFAPLAMTPGL